MATPRSYPSDAPFAAFPLGGIGTGTISLGARGDLRDFELFGHPDKGCKMPFSFFAIRAEQQGAIDARVLEAAGPPDFYQARGYHPNRVAGLPHLARSTLQVAYPIATVAFADDTFPLSVSLEAFTPFIPLDAEDSAIPAALFRYRVKNATGAPLKAAIACSMPNPHAFVGFDCFDNYLVQPGCHNALREEAGLYGLYMDGEAVGPSHLRYANGAILTRRAEGVSAKREWRKTGWWDGLYDFWDDFTGGGPLADGEIARQDNRIAPKGCVVGSLAIERTIPAGEERTFEFVLSWYVPNRVKGWPPYADDEAEPLVRNHYATRFSDAWHAGSYLLENLDRLESASRAFAEAVYSSTLPEPVIDAAMANITALRSTTCFRIEDGTFAAWEGSHERVGSCHGTCTHVWNYAQTVAFLFPELEKTARRNELLTETDDDGRMAFRTDRLFGRPRFDMLPAADGQLGTIVRTYREWSLTGDDAFLRALWPKLVLAIDFVQKEWDLDGDGLLEARQHNTYDIEFYGVNPLTGVLYLAALAAMARMARHLGDADLADAYDARRNRSAEGLDARAFAGEYYIQQLDDVDAHAYQHGIGCLSDQLFGQTLAYLTGLGPLLPREHLRSAAAAIFRHNFKSGPERGACLQRLYVAPDESGLVLASWPEGGRPKLPFVYADEVWTGIEYQVATLLIYEDMLPEALTIIETVRARQDGYRRNPFNEMECGFHYARSLASWGPLVALSGASYDAVTDTERFDPKVHQDDFHCFYSNGRSWGMLHQTRRPDGGYERRVEVLGRRSEG